MRIGPWIINVTKVPSVEKPKAVPVRDMFAEGYNRHGQMIGVISIISNGYLVSLGEGNGSIAEVCYAANEVAVGTELLRFIAERNLK